MVVMSVYVRCIRQSIGLWGESEILKTLFFTVWNSATKESIGLWGESEH
jgi:hypothetical protein